MLKGKNNDLMRASLHVSVGTPLKILRVLSTQLFFHTTEMNTFFFINRESSPIFMEPTCLDFEIIKEPTLHLMFEFKSSL